MQIKRTIKGHTFSVQLRAVERAGQLANGVPAYTAHVTIYRDGRDIGSGRWHAEGFLNAPIALDDWDDSEDVYGELTRAVHEHLAALPAETPVRADGEASTQRVTFAPGLRGYELRTMAGNARVIGAIIGGPVGAAWRALADALDAAADRDERTARAPASPPAESPAPELERVDFTAEQDGNMWILRGEELDGAVWASPGSESIKFSNKIVRIKWGETCPPKPIEVWLERKGGV